MNIFKLIRKSQSGQTATEYMLIIAVVVLGTVAGASFLVPAFRTGVQDLAGRIQAVLTNQTQTGTITSNQ